MQERTCVYSSYAPVLILNKNIWFLNLPVRIFLSDRVNAGAVEQEFENFPHEMSAGQVRS